MNRDYIKGLKFDDIPVSIEHGKPILPTVVFIDPKKN